MNTLLLRLIGPMQSWGTTSRFDNRDTTLEPSKSGVIGLVAAAMGIDRNDWNSLEPLTRLRMGVRHDRPGVLMKDYQTAKDIVSADRKKQHDTAVTNREYLADAAFLVGLESSETELLRAINAALQQPIWTLGLGRKSYVPSEPIWIVDGLHDNSIEHVMKTWPWIGESSAQRDKPLRLFLSLEGCSEVGKMRMDQPLSSFAERKFGARFVESRWIPFPEN